MNAGCFYEIQIDGQLPDRWSAWFEGLAIRPEPQGCTTLCGRLVDQAALFGVLNKIHALNLVLVSVRRRG